MKRKGQEDMFNMLHAPSLAIKKLQSRKMMGKYCSTLANSTLIILFSKLLKFSKNISFK